VAKKRKRNNEEIKSMAYEIESKYRNGGNGKKNERRNAKKMKKSVEEEEAEKANNVNIINSKKKYNEKKN